LKGSPEFDKVNEIAPLLNEANLVWKIMKKSDVFRV
jgi:hypothetical protein